MTKKKSAATNGTAAKAATKEAEPQQASQVDAEMAAKISQLRAALRENFGKVVMALSMVPRYRSQMLSDLQHLVLDPILQDRIAMAYPGKDAQGTGSDMAGFAIWASVSEDVDAKIREQIANGVFPVRLKSDEWNSGSINWLLDVVAQEQSTITTVIANFRQVVKDGELRLHPLISRMVDPETLEKMGARKSPDGAPNEAAAES